jgi:hypothetical protein
MKMKTINTLDYGTLPIVETDYEFVYDGIFGQVEEADTGIWYNVQKAFSGILVASPEVA